MNKKQLLKEIEKARKETERPQFDDEDFSGMDLSGLDLKWGFFNDANFENANLSGSDFEGAIMPGANFKGANLTGTNFRDACLYDVEITDNFKESKLDGAVLKRPDPTGVLHIKKLGEEGMEKLTKEQLIKEHMKNIVMEAWLGGNSNPDIECSFGEMTEEQIRSEYERINSLFGKDDDVNGK